MKQFFEKMKKWQKMTKNEQKLDKKWPKNKNVEKNVEKKTN